MQIRRGFLGWGVFLILAGAIPLLVRSGYLDADQVGRLWQLWPLILVGIGVGLILGRTPFDFIGGLIVAATLGAMVGGLLSIGFLPLSSGICGGDDGTAAFPARDGTFATGGTIDLQMDCGTVSVSVASDDGWHVAGSDADGSGPDIKATDASLSVRSRNDHPGAFWIFGPRDRWDVSVPNASTVDLALHVDAGRATVDLEAATLGGLDLELNAASATVDLGIGPGDRRARRQPQCRLARADPAEPVAARHHRNQRRRREAVRSSRRRPQAADWTRASPAAMPTTGTVWSRRDRPGRPPASKPRLCRSSCRRRRTRARSRSIRRAAVTERLYRSRDDRMLAGVAGGVAELLDIDPSLIRIVWLLVAILTGGIAVVVYIVMAIVVPERPVGLGSGAASTPGAAQPGAPPAADGISSPPGRRSRDPADRGRAGFVIGAVLVIVGVLFLIRELIPALDLGLWWPIAAIGLGILLIVMAVAPRRSG